ncbi:nicotinamidase-like [Mytilus galloprovincialis]|uniref:nicotinamidase-like n=1 Tax=Mytilus galloprovincialis TaxID=29158 RepID=UPI003F7CD079
MISPCWLSAITFILLLDLTCTRQIALLIIDVQNCFLPGGSLAVTEGDQVIPVINNIRSEYKADLSLVVLSQDWHCSDHISFASQHKGARKVIQLLYDKSGSLCDENNSCTEVAYNLTQHLWPDHCVINTPSANFSHNLVHEPSDLVVRKGYNCKVDSYSAFYDNGGFRHTELHDKLQEAGIDSLIITGLARDYCVYYTAMDAKKLGYETYVVLDATRPVTKATGDSTVADMKIKGIQIIESPDVAGVIVQLTSDANYLHSTFILMISIILCFFKCL